MSQHLKRLSVPRRWSLPRKTHEWAPSPSPGPHAADEGVPLVVALRDMLEVCDTAGEAEQILGQRRVRVDGRVATDPNRPIGLMDVVSFDVEEIHYRVLQDERGRIRLVEIDADEADWKLCRVEDKTHVQGGKIQINLHDGRNVLVNETDTGTGDVLRIGLPDQEVKGSFAFEPGNVALITGGQHAGEVATISKLEVVRSNRPNIVQLEAGDEEIETIEPYAFVVGDDRPVIELPEVSILG